MIHSDYLERLVSASYSEKRAEREAAEYDAEQRLLAHPDYSDVKYELGGVIFDMEKALFQGKTELAEKLGRRRGELTKLKNELTAKYSEAAITIAPDCPICSDSGMVGGERCHCYYEKMTREAMGFLGLKKHPPISFSDDKLSGVNGSELLFKKFRRYAEKFGADSPSLLFLGSVGTGKTFLASAIADCVSKKNFCVIFATAVEFGRSLLDFHLANDFDKRVYYDVYTTCDLLVIDDLGTEPIYKNVTLEYLLLVLSARYAEKRATIVTSNLSPEALMLRYGERIYSRLTAKSVIKQNFTGKDLRKA